MKKILSLVTVLFMCLFTFTYAYGFGTPVDKYGDPRTKNLKNNLKSIQPSPINQYKTQIDNRIKAISFTNNNNFNLDRQASDIDKQIIKLTRQMKARNVKLTPGQNKTINNLLGSIESNRKRIYNLKVQNNSLYSSIKTATANKNYAKVLQCYTQLLNNLKEISNELKLIINAENRILDLLIRILNTAAPPIIAPVPTPVPYPDPTATPVLPPSPMLTPMPPPPANN